MPTIRTDVNFRWAWEGYQRWPDGSTRSPSTTVGTVVQSTVRFTEKGIPPFILHNNYNHSVSPAPLVKFTGWNYRRNTNGTWFYTQFHSGSSNSFLYSPSTGPQNPVTYWEVPTRLQNLAILDLYSNMAEAKVGVGQMLAEVQKTSAGVLQPLSQLINAVRSARRLDWVGTLKALGIKRHNWRANAKNVGARWLEVSFGWIPLLNDIDDLVQNAIRPNYEPLRFTVRGKKWEELDETVDVPTSVGKRFYTRKGRRGFTASMVVEVDDAWFRAGNLYGIKPLPLIWELSPFSFLTDYFTPIGDWLNAQSALDGLRFVSGSVSYLYDAQHQELFEGTWSQGRHDYNYHAASGFKIFNMNRTKMLKPPSASLALKTPLTSWKKAGNMVALLLQTLK